MALKQFLAALAKTRRTWQFVRGMAGNRIRDAAKRGRCPLESVAGGKPGDGLEAAQLIGVSEAEAIGVCRAADHDYRHDPTLRAQILVACGLREDI